MRNYTIIPVILFMFSCATTGKIKDGRTAYDQKQYAVAIPMLESEAESPKDTREYAELSYLLGDSYKQINDTDNSLKWFIEAAKNDHSPEAFYEMAYVLRKKQRYEDAILSYQRLERMVSRPEEIRKEIEKCRQAQRMMVSKEHPYVIEPISANSEASDYAPSLLDGNTLVFTSDRLGDGENLEYKWTGKAFSDLYRMNLKDQKVEKFDALINTEHNEGSASFSLDGSEMYYTYCHQENGDSYCKIYRSERNGSFWTSGQPAFRMKPQVNYGDPVLIENDQVLIFVSNDPTGIGGHDLYYSVREEDDSWSDPELMPTYLNSIGQERFPRWHNGKLYYSSDFFAGLGGLDIFWTQLMEDGSWTIPENMQTPFNSSEDDFALVFVDSSLLEPAIKMQAYFTSSRGLISNDNIYIITEYRDPSELIESIDPEPDTIEIVQAPKSYYLNIQLVEKQFAIPDDPNSYVVGVRPVADASLKINEWTDLMRTDQRGNALILLDSVDLVRILAGKEGYLNRKTEFNKANALTEDFPDGHIFRITMELDKLFEGVPVVLENIYYDYNESFIREDAKPALNYLVKLLEENPAIQIELGSHTDCRGEPLYNQDLSQRRAAAAVEYIIESGKINPNRLSAIGYGESQLEETCLCEECSEDEHQVNRRTTFVIRRK